MSKHLDGSPQPVDPLWLRQQEWMRVRCPCGRRASLHIGALALQHCLPSTLRLWEVVYRLRCLRCGRRAVIDGVGPRPG